MTNEDIFSHIDHTLLSATATEKDIQKRADEAEKYHMASVCIPSAYVASVRDRHPHLTITTVIGFPLGNTSTEAKIAEAAIALRQGADEIDMVMAIGALKEGCIEKVKEEIRKVKKAIDSHILKVIIETAYLTEEEKIQACLAVSEGGADYIKTSTGFAPHGATIEDIRLFRKHISSNVKIKAAGGIRTKEEMETYLALGVDRIGTSHAMDALIEK